jgi:hypothetical protein
MLKDGTIEHTLLTAFGVESNWIAIAPVLVAIALAVWLAAMATPATRLGGLRAPLVLLGAWVVVAIVGPSVAGRPVEPLDGDPGAVTGVCVAAAVSVLALLWIRYRERRAELAASQPISGELALGERT